MLVSSCELITLVFDENKILFFCFLLMWSSQSVIAKYQKVILTVRQRLGIPKKKTVLNNFQPGLSFNFSGHVTFLFIFQALAHFYISPLPPFFIPPSFSVIAFH